MEREKRRHCLVAWVRLVDPLNLVAWASLISSGWDGHLGCVGFGYKKLNLSALGLPSRSKLIHMSDLSSPWQYALKLAMVLTLCRTGGFMGKELKILHRRVNKRTVFGSSR